MAISKTERIYSKSCTANCIKDFYFKFNRKLFNQNQKQYQIIKYIHYKFINNRYIRQLNGHLHHRYQASSWTKLRCTHHLTGHGWSPELYLHPARHGERHLHRLRDMAPVWRNRMQAVRPNESSDDFSVVPDAGYNFIESSLVNYFFFSKFPRKDQRFVQLNKKKVLFTGFHIWNTENSLNIFFLATIWFDLQRPNIIQATPQNFPRIS